ncbi:hypothetical protein AB1Y20_006351 [Prymnesium parvum]|uniref:Sugar phosphate transporter domain-containing protein n=1 Tax=Prymnesium parvum TaxID=97485 RepID=A0AB34J2E9_PRYPA
MDEVVMCPAIAKLVGAMAATQSSAARWARCVVTKDDLVVAGWFCFFLALNLEMNFLLKWAMSLLAVPTFQAFFDSVFSALLLGAVMRGSAAFGSASLHDLRAQGGELSVFAAFFMLSVVLNNASLASLSLSINQIIKGCGPLPTLVFTVALTRVLPRPWTVVAIVVIILGTGLAIPFGSADATTAGVLLALGSVLATAGRQAFSQHLMGRKQGQTFEPIVLVFWQSVLAAPCLLALWLCNVGDERTKVLDFWHAQPALAIGMSVAISASAIAYTVTMYYFTRLTSAVTLTIAGSVKMVLLILIPALVDPHIFSAINWVGACIYLAGFLMYTYLGHLENVAKLKSENVTENTPLGSKLPPPGSKENV